MMIKNFLGATALGVLLIACDDRDDYLVTIKTPMGDMTVLLYEETPLHKQNFLALARSGQYDSTEWHRVMEDFMIQGGNVFAASGKAETDADRIPAEIVNGLYHVKGALAAARQPDQVNPERMSSGSQFYIVDGKSFSEEEMTIDQVRLNQGLSQLLQQPEYDSLYQLFVQLQQNRASNEEMNKLALSCVDIVEKELNVDLRKDVKAERLQAYKTTEGSPHLDGEYTIFGRVVEGMEVIDKIAAVSVGPGNRPVETIRLTMEVVAVPKKEVTKKYGYDYPKKD